MRSAVRRFAGTTGGISRPYDRLECYFEESLGLEIYWLTGPPTFRFCPDDIAVIRKILLTGKNIQSRSGDFFAWHKNCPDRLFWQNYANVSFNQNNRLKNVSFNQNNWLNISSK